MSDVLFIFLLVKINFLSLIFEKIKYLTPSIFSHAFKTIANNDLFGHAPFNKVPKQSNEVCVVCVGVFTVTSMCTLQKDTPISAISI